MLTVPQTRSRKPAFREISGVSVKKRPSRLLFSRCSTSPPDCSLQSGTPFYRHHFYEPDLKSKNIALHFVLRDLKVQLPRSASRTSKNVDLCSCSGHRTHRPHHSRNVPIAKKCSNRKINVPIGKSYVPSPNNVPTAKRQKG